MKDSNLDKFLKENRGPVPSAPRNEFDLILKRIEDNKSIFELLKEAFESKPMWATGFATAVLALTLTVNVNKNYFSMDSVEEAFLVSSSLYVEDLSPLDASEFLE